MEKNMNSFTGNWGKTLCAKQDIFFLSVLYSNSRCIHMYLQEISERENTVRPNYRGIVFSMNRASQSELKQYLETNGNMKT